MRQKQISGYRMSAFSFSKALETAHRHGFGFTLITKSDLVLRDIDIMKAINEKTKCVVQMTLTAYDDDLSRIIERGICVTSR